MARGTSQRERAEATPVTVLTPNEDGDYEWDDDVESAFAEWRNSFKTGQEPGKIRCFQIPLDSRGTPIANAKNQYVLGAWPIDMYNYDELMAMLSRDFMPAEKILAVRMIGTEPGKQGVRFNKIVVLRAPKDAPNPNAGNGRESTADIMRAINENNERMMAQFRAMLESRAPPDPSAEIRRMVETANLLNGPANKLMELLVPALVGRAPTAPAPVENPFAQLSGLIDAFGKLADLRGGGGGGGDGDNASSGNDVVDAIRAIGPIAKAGLEALPAILASRQPGVPPQLTGPRPAAPPGAPAAAAPGAPRPPPPGSVPTTPPPPNTPQPSPTALGDIPSGDQEMFAQLKPQIDALVKMAGEGSDPTAAADLLFEQAIMPLPDELYSRVGDVIGGPKFLEQAAVFNPGVTAHAAWFTQFRTRIVERFDAEEKAAQGPTPA